MSAPVDVFDLLDRQLKDRAERAARYGKQADKAAAKHGNRQVTADRMAEHARILLAELLTLRQELADLIEVARRVERKAITQSRLTSSVFTSDLAGLRVAVERAQGGAA
jgi:hypothetical protein